MRRLLPAILPAIATMLVSGCAAKAPDAAGQTTPTTVTELSPAPEQTASPRPATSSKAPAPSWPTPEDCVSYNPSNVTVSFSGDLYTVADGGTVVLRVAGQTGDGTGDKVLALAKRYAKHCYLGRTNNREEKNSFVFDYWRNQVSGAAPVPGSEDDCSQYDNHNLTVEDMGDGNGWRVKDHDHVLGLFDNETDARNGKLVLAKYGQICTIGNGDNDPEVITYFR